MSSEIQSDSLVENVKKIFVEKGYDNVTVCFESCTNKGDGYIGVVVRGIITFVANGKKKTLDVMVKCTPRKVEARTNMPITEAFLREIVYYKLIVPVYEMLQNNLNIPDEIKYVFPKCYGTQEKFNEELLLLENLKIQGYCMMKVPVMDYEHASAALRVLAKLHGLSFIYQKRCPEEFDSYTRTSTDIFADKNEFNHCNFYKYNQKAYDKMLNVIKNEDHKKLLINAIGNNLGRKLTSLWGSGNIKVITHGDFWANNVLFKYEDEKPVSVIALDFQLTRYASLANDFIYLFGMSSEAELRRKHFWNLVNDYHQALELFLRAAGYDVDEFCSLDQFKIELKKQSLFGLAMAVFVLPHFTSGVIFDNNSIMAGELPEEFYTDSDAYIKRANDIVADFVDFGFI